MEAKAIYLVTNLYVVIKLSFSFTKILIFPQFSVSVNSIITHLTSKLEVHYLCIPVTITHPVVFRLNKSFFFPTEPKTATNVFFTHGCGLVAKSCSTLMFHTWTQIIPLLLQIHTQMLSIALFE